MNYLMSVDLGSTTLKASIYDLEGNRVAAASRPTEKHSQPENPEWVVWEPDQIWGGSAAAIREALSRIEDPSLVRAIAVTGMGMDGVPVDRAGNHLYPFISWHDARTAEQAAWWADNVGAERSFGIAGLPAWAITAAMRILWMKKNRPEIMAQTDKWLLIEDFVNRKLSGKTATDFSMATCMLLFDQKNHCWSSELLEASGIDGSLLPPPMPSATVLGTVTPEAAAATGLSTETVVVLGGHDHLCGTLPVGAYKPGTLFDVMGTWEVLIASTSRAVTTPAICKAGICMQSHVVPGIYAAWGGAPSGESLEWYRKTLGFDAEMQQEEDWGEICRRISSRMLDTRPGAGGALYLPYISSAGCPVNDDKAMGAFVGLSTTTRKEDLFRAVIEGVNYQFLDIVSAMQSGLATEFNHIIVAGGVAQNEFLVQNKADMLGKPVEVASNTDATPLGAAMLAGVGVGLYESIDQACEMVKGTTKTYSPNRALTAEYKELYTLFRELYPALKPLSHKLFNRFKC